MTENLIGFCIFRGVWTSQDNLRRSGCFILRGSQGEVSRDRLLCEFDFWMAFI